MPQPKAKQNDEQGSAATVAPESQMVETLLDKAYELREAYGHYLKARKANRTMLRSLVEQGFATDEQRAEIAEVYPERASAEDDPPTAEDTPKQADDAPKAA